MSDVNGLCNAVSGVIPDVYLVDRVHRFKVNAKSQLACMLASAQWSEIYIECEEDIYSIIEKWVARDSNVTIHE